MPGYTTKYAGSQTVEGGTLVFVEEHPADARSVTAAPCGAATRHVEIGVYDTPTAQAILADLRRRFPPGVATPEMTEWDIQQIGLSAR